MDKQKRALVAALRGDALSTKDARVLAELGFRLTHSYFSSDEYVTMNNASGYPINGSDWNRFWSDRNDFPATWKIIQ